MNTPAPEILSQAFAVALVFALISAPCLAQSYHYSSGGSRVVNQSQIGLPYHDSSYIGPGTLSQTAQGKPVGGAQANPLLPKVPWGANIQTPGDNFYTKDRVTKTTSQGVPAGIPQSNWGANVKQPGDNMRSDMGNQAIQYTPGQIFQRPSRTPQQPRQYSYTPGRNGMATYGDDTANGSGSTTNKY
ncbi:MAG TPA: hypothetical protein V6D17_12185 [Candidatus Obscuribacterales bacterium]